MKKFALIGSGSMAKNYLKTLEDNKEAKIIAILSKTNRNLKNIKGDYYKTTDVKTILGLKLNGVIIATPASTHFKLTEFFLKKGFNVLVEKPLTTSLKDALKLKRVKSKGKIMVGHTLLFHPAYIELKKTLKNEEISYITFEGYNNKSRSDTSLIWDWGPHPASLLLDLIPGFPKHIKRLKYTKKEIILLLNYKNKVDATIKLGWNSSVKKRRLTVKTQTKEYIFDDLATIKLESHSHENNKITFIKYPDISPLVLELREFTKAVNKRRFISDLNFGINTIKLLTLCSK